MSARAWFVFRAWAANLWAGPVCPDCYERHGRDRWHVRSLACRLAKIDRQRQAEQERIDRDPALHPRRLMPLAAQEGTP